MFYRVFHNCKQNLLKYKIKYILQNIKYIKYKILLKNNGDRIHKKLNVINQRFMSDKCGRRQFFYKLKPNSKINEMMKFSLFFNSLKYKINYLYARKLDNSPTKKKYHSQISK